MKKIILLAACLFAAFATADRNNQPKMTGRKEAGKSNRVAVISKPQAVEMRPTMADAS